MRRTSGERDVKQLIYHSRPFGFDEAMLSGILSQARRNNQRDGITGALICRQDLYLQLIEGPIAAIETLYAKIAADDRHADVTLAFSELVDQRLFPDWAMLDDSMPGVSLSLDSIEDGAIENAPPEALHAAFVMLADRARG